MVARNCTRYLAIAVTLLFVPFLTNIYAQNQVENTESSDALPAIQEQFDILADSINGIESRIADDLLENLSSDLTKQQKKLFDKQTEKIKQVAGEIVRLDEKLTAIQEDIENEEMKRLLEQQIEKQNAVIQEGLDGLSSEVKDLEFRLLESRKEDLFAVVENIIQQSSEYSLIEREAIVAEIQNSRAQVESDKEKLLQQIDSRADGTDDYLLYGLVPLSCLILVASGAIIYFGRKSPSSGSSLDVPVLSGAEDETHEFDSDARREEEPDASSEDMVAEPDHTVAILTAQEVHKMKSRVDSLSHDDKAKKPLLKALERLESGLTDSGYEIFDHTGTRYNDGMNIIPRFIPIKDVEEYTITRVIKPQLNYQGKSISLAEIEVAVGSKD